ncbi:hypothetical protein G9A89_020408 [Geosiphon pyriformis]|nr:hypothetical protein G9A89_020408 [Geosiphon pyriformis]
MEITNSIHSLVQQLFQLIQQQEMEITINQQTIRYTNTKKEPQDKIQKKTENTVNKIITKVKLAIETQPKVTQYQEKNNLTTQARIIYWLHTGFQDRPEILLNPKINSITINQMGKITNAQFEELQNKIA